MTLPSRRSLLAAAALAAALPFGAPSAQAQAWPDKPIRIVVGFAPGGFTDVLGRLIGQKLPERLGQPVVVDDKPGAAGILGGSSEDSARFIATGSAAFARLVKEAKITLE